MLTFHYYNIVFVTDQTVLNIVARRRQNARKTIGFGSDW